MMLTALLIAARGVHIAASVLIAGTFTFDLLTFGINARSVRDDYFREVGRRLFRLALWSLVAALLSALLWFWLEVANMNGLSLKNGLSPTAWQKVLFETQFGRVWQLRLGLIVAAFVLVTSALAQIQAPKVLIVVLWVTSIVLLVSLAWISHAAAATAHRFGMSGDMLHLCAAGLWTGGLIPLWIFLASKHASLSLGEIGACVVRRFSTLSLWCVSVLVVSGISNSWVLVGSIHPLFTTAYGRLLLVKLALFAVVVTFGARNRFLVKAKLTKAAADEDLLAQLRRNVFCEACLGCSRRDRRVFRRDAARPTPMTPPKAAAEA